MVVAIFNQLLIVSSKLLKQSRLRLSQLVPMSRSAKRTLQYEFANLILYFSNKFSALRATKILCDRFMKNSEAKRLLISDFHSPNPELQENALKALTLLDCHAVSGDWYSSSELADLPLRSAYFRTLPVRGARARPHEESPEEQALRRRRREAMVLNEGDRPVSQDDIIQRGGRITDDETRIAEQALATLARMERVRAAAQGDNST
jgi:hypothetical protein